MYRPKELTGFGNRTCRTNRAESIQKDKSRVRQNTEPVWFDFLIGHRVDQRCQNGAPLPVRSECRTEREERPAEKQSSTRQPCSDIIHEEEMERGHLARKRGDVISAIRKEGTQNIEQTNSECRSKESAWFTSACD